jgi:hypothetical protein
MHPRAVGSPQERLISFSYRAITATGRQKLDSGGESSMQRRRLEASSRERKEIVSRRRVRGNSASSQHQQQVNGRLGL